MKPYTKDDIISIYEQIKSCSKKSAPKHKWLKSLKFIEAAANWAYSFNWIYYDEELELLLKEIAQNTQSDVVISNPDAQKAVIIDSFCLDNRGLTQQYIRAMMSNQMAILYICTANTIKEKSDILSELRDYSKACILLFTDKSSNQIEKASKIIETITLFSPASIFLHLTPNDTSALIACHMIKGATVFNINLTDHAFWMGGAFINYNIEFRPYGETVSLEKRGLSELQLLVLPYYPITPRSNEFKGLPELPSNSVIVFTGGALYKMLGKNDAFFKIMDAILDLSPKVYVLVAGFNTEPQFDARQIAMKNKDRVIKIGRRNDIDIVFNKIDIYLNTYPTSGALMVQYAAKHGKPILSYYDKDDLEGRVEELLNHYQDVFESYTDMNEYLGYALKLISDVNFRKLEGKKLQNGLMTQEKFAEEFKKALKTHKSAWGVGHDEIDYERFFERYIDLENNNGFAASKSIVKMLRSDVIQIKGYRWKFFRILSELAVDKVKRMVGDRYKELFLNDKSL